MLRVLIPTLFLLALRAASGAPTEPVPASVPPRAVVVDEIPGPVVRFGYLKPMKAYGEQNYQPGEPDIRRPLSAYLRRSLPEVRFDFVEYELKDLLEVVRRHEVDFALMSSGQYVEALSSGAYALATVYTRRFPDPNRFTAALFVTRVDRTDVSTIADMKGLRAAFNNRANFINYQLPLAEIALAGFNPDNFFAREVFTDDRPPEVLNLLRTGRADVGVFRVCEYETLMDLHPELRGAFKPVAVKTGGNQACLRSTDLYPGWTVAVTSSINPALTKAVARALFEMPVDPASGLGWSVATEFARVNDLFRLIRMGPYAHLRDWTVHRIWDEHREAIIVLTLLLLGWVMHWLSVERLAERRARALTEAHRRQLETEAKAMAAEERSAALSRQGVVSQLSSIFAHEMGQPLSAIRYRARGLAALVRQGRGTQAALLSALRTIDEQSEKAAGILQKVHAYAKGRTSRETPVRLDLLVANTAADLRHSGRLLAPASIALAPVTVKGDELELSIAVLNILKNAAEAAGGALGALIEVKLELKDGRARLSVVNTGRALTPEKLLASMTPLASQKANGIGLGLIIISSIAEAHGGSFSLRPRPEGGAAALLTLPVLVEDSPSCPPKTPSPSSPTP